jgi:hypothetical protein
MQSKCPFGKLIPVYQAVHCLIPEDSNLRSDYFVIATSLEIYFYDFYFLQVRSKHRFMNMKARVKMNMKAQLDEEMDLHEGDIVNVTEIVDKNWYRCVTF